MPPQPDEHSWASDWNNSVNALYWIASIHALAITMFIRCGFGAEGIGLTGVGTLLLILFCGANTNDPAMIVFLFAWIIALFVQRAITWRQSQQGLPVHSRYGGYPWLGVCLSLGGGVISGLTMEPPICLLLGLPLLAISSNLAAFVMCGALSLLITNVFELEIGRRRIRRLRDAEIEMREMTQLWQNQKHRF